LKTAVKKAAPSKKVVPASKPSSAKKSVAKAPAKKVVKAAPAVKSAPLKTVPAKPTVVSAKKPVAAKSKPAPVSKPAPAPVAKVTPPPVTKAAPQPTVTQKYSDADLAEFKELINKKLADAREELVNLQAQIINANENGTDDTGASFKMLEDGSETLAKEEAANLAARQKKFIDQLESALIRIQNKTYGICRITGKLIPKERLRAVPHTTQSMEAKLKQYKD
jgi:RNA polymerase-binding transcription factor DksA